MPKDFNAYVRIGRYSGASDKVFIHITDSLSGLIVAIVEFDESEALNVFTNRQASGKGRYFYSSNIGDRRLTKVVEIQYKGGHDSEAMEEIYSKAEKLYPDWRVERESSGWNCHRYSVRGSEYYYSVRLVKWISSKDSVE